MSYKSPFLESRDRLFENEVGFVIYDKYSVNEGHCQWWGDFFYE